MSDNFGFPEYALMTAHTTPVAELGDRFFVKEHTNFSSRLGYWEVIYYRAYSAVNEGELVACHQQAISNITSGTTTTALHGAVAGNVAGYLENGVVHVDDTVTTTAPEGESSIITANTTTTLTFSPALTVALALNDDLSVHCPFMGQAGAATSGMALIGLCLATLAAGEYGFALRRGMYPNAEFVTADKVDIGSGVAAAANGQFIEYDVATHTLSGPIGYVCGARLVGETPTNFPVIMALP
jgi:hypothetical protein